MIQCFVCAWHLEGNWDRAEFIRESSIFFFFFEDVIHSSTERLTPHNAGHPGAIYGQGINFFPCVRRPFASCLEAKCVSSEIISEGVACSCQSQRGAPWETPISSEVLPVGGGADQFHASLMRNEHSPLARGLSLPRSFLSLAGVRSKPTLRGTLVILGSEPPDVSDQLSLSTQERFASPPGQNWV